MRFETALLTTVVILALCLCVPRSGFSTEPTPRPPRASGLKATTMELKLHEDINNARQAGRDTTAAEKLKAQGDAEVKQGRLGAAINHYEQAEKALGSAK